MADLEALVIELQLKTQNLETGLNQAQSKIKNFGKAAHESAGGLGKLKEGMGELVGSFAKGFAILEMVNFLREAGKVAADDAQSFALLSNQLKNTTGATAKQTKAFDDQLESMGEMAGVKLPALRQSFSTLVRATGSSTKAMQLQKLALDLAAGAHVPVTAAAKALGRAVDGNTGALLRLDPKLKGSTNMLGDVQKHFKGAAEAAANANPYSRLGVVMEKIKVTLGTALLPVISMFGKLLIQLMPTIVLLGKLIASLVTAVTPFINALLKALMPVLKIIVKVVLDLMTIALKPFEGIMKDLMPTITILAKTIGDLLIALEPVLRVIVKLLPIMFGLSFIMLKLATVVLPPLINIFDKVLVPVIAIVSKAIEILFDAFGKLGNYLGNIFKPVVDAVGKAFQALGDFIKPIWDNVLKPLLESMERVLGIKVDATANVKVKTNGKDLQKQVSDSLDASLMNVSSAKATKTAKTSKATSKHGHTINTTINTHTDATAKQIANNVVNAIKFNIPIAGNYGGSSMGSQVATG